MPYKTTNYKLQFEQFREGTIPTLDFPAMQILDDSECLAAVSQVRMNSGTSLWCSIS